MTTKEYKEASVESDKYKEKHDCAVVAVSIATGIDYNVVHAIFAKFGRENGLGVDMDVIESVLEYFNFLWVDENRFSAKTMKTLGRQLTHEKGTFLVTVSRHISCAKDGFIHDWIAGRQIRIIEIIRIIDVG